MAISKEQLASIISGRAKHLCNTEGDRLISEYTINSKGKNPDPSNYDYDTDTFDRMYLSTLDEDRESMDINYSTSTAANSKMPEHIKKSMLEQRIDTSVLGQTSVLDTLGVKVPSKKQRISQVTEQVAQVSPVTAGIDYSIIKAIVNECLKEYFSKQQLNESASLQTIGISNGTISLVDNKGNIFKAKLEKIGNTNEKK